MSARPEHVRAHQAWSMAEMRRLDPYHRVDSRSIALPHLQRRYVWNREQVRGLMQHVRTS